MEIEKIRKICNPIKLKIYDEIKKNPKQSINQISKSCGIDYKNCYRYIKELEKKGILKLESKGKDKSTYIYLK